MTSLKSPTLDVSIRKSINMDTKESNFRKKLIAIEIELGFLRVPSKHKKNLPPKPGKIRVFINESKHSVQLRWDPKNQRIYGLVSFFRDNNAKPGDKVEIGYKSEKTYKLNFLKTSTEEKVGEEITKQEAEEIIDLIVIKNGVYQPIFLQVKSNFKLHSGRSLLVQVSDRTLNPHHTLFVVGVYFNPKELEIDEKIAFIPSKVIKEEGNKVKLQKGNIGYRASVSLRDGSSARFTQYLVKKTDFVNKLLEKFSEIEEYYK
ncbi:MAG: hypothetical protein GXP44_01070 [bacterium]|nr:hypothetical protein [bacterium]